MRKFIRIFLGVVIIIASLGVYFYPNIREWKTQQEVNQIMAKFENDFKADDTSSKSEKKSDEKSVEESESTSDDETENTSDGEIKNFVELHKEMEEYNQRLATDGQHIVDAWSYEQPPLSLDNMPNNDYTIGYVEIPDMKVKLPLLLGASKDNLSKGAAVLSETSMPIGGTDTNCVIAAHRGWKGSAFFQRIENLKEGSKVYVTNPWETMVYQVVSTKIVEPDDNNSILLQPGKDMVTLVTCHPYVLGGGKYRYIVYCERAGSEERTEATQMENPAIDDTDDSNNTNDTVTDTDSVQLSEEEVEESDNLLKWEAYLRKYLPLGTAALALLIIIVRRPKKEKGNKKS